MKSSRIAADSPENRLNGWRQYFSELLGGVAMLQDDWMPFKIYSDIDIRSGPCDLAELDFVISQMKNNKACGIDLVSTESLKVKGVSSILLPYINSVLESGLVFDEWRKSIIIALPKKGDLSQYSNYRGIALMSIAGKVYNRLLLLRIRDKIDKLLRPTQNGFRQHRGTCEHILAMRRLVEDTSIRKGGFLVLTFIDFKKAFDSINRSRMFKVMSAYGVSDRVIRQVSAMYANTTAMVRTIDGMSDEFDINAGVLQGDTLAPFLFVWMVDYILRCALKESGVEFILQSRNGRRSQTIAVSDFAFADDVALVASSILDAQKLLLSIEKFAAELGLLLNANKTEFMIVSADPQIDLSTFSLYTNNGTVLKQVNDFKYLGSWIRNSRADVTIRIAQAWSAAVKLRSIWKSRLDVKFKRQFFQAIVVSILLYSCETWSMTKTLEKRLDGAYTKLLRYASGVTWKDYIKNTDLYHNLCSISHIVCTRRIRFAGHCLRAKNQMVHHLVLRQPRRGEFRRGGGSTLTYPKILLTDLLRAGLITRGTTTLEIADIAQDRNLWKSYVKTLQTTCSNGAR